MEKHAALPSELDLGWDEPLISTLPQPCESLPHSSRFLLTDFLTGSSFTLLSQVYLPSGSQTWSDPTPPLCNAPGDSQSPQRKSPGRQSSGADPLWPAPPHSLASLHHSPPRLCPAPMALFCASRSPLHLELAPRHRTAPPSLLPTHHPSVGLPRSP